MGYKMSQEALGIAEESGDSFSKTVGHNIYGVSCYFKGFFKEAEEHLLKATISCERMNLFSFGAYSHYCLGDLYFDCGEYGKSGHHNDKALHILEQAHIFPYQANLARIALTRAQAKETKRKIDLRIFLDIATTNSVQTFKGWMSRYISEILLDQGGQDLVEAGNWIKKAIEFNQKNDMRWSLARDYRTYAEILWRKGKKNRATENLNKTINIFKECGADGWVEKYEKELAEL